MLDVGNGIKLQVLPEFCDEDAAIALIKEFVNHPTNYGGITADDALGMLRSGAWQAQMIVGKGMELFCVYQIIEHNTGKELYILGITGKGLVFNTKKVLIALEFIMKHEKCHFLVVNTKNEALKKRIRKLRFVEINTVFLRCRTEA